VKDKDAYISQYGDKPYLNVRTYELADIILNAPADQISKVNDPFFGILKMLGKGNCVLYIETTEEWSKKRASVMKAFSFDNLKGMTDIMRRSTTALIEQIIKEGALEKETYDIAPHLASLSGTIVCESGFGIGTGNYIMDYFKNGKNEGTKTIGAMIK
jgi:cytochrome P450